MLQLVNTTDTEGQTSVERSHSSQTPFPGARRGTTWNQNFDQFEGRRLDLMVDDRELERRRRAWTPPSTAHRCGYPRLYIDHVLQANKGCDFDFLRPDDTGSLTFFELEVGLS